MSQKGMGGGRKREEPEQLDNKTNAMAEHSTSGSDLVIWSDGDKT
jgi:hypothetical protein